MNTYYYTENLRLKNDILEYKHKEDFTNVKKHNWHHILTEYGWEKINKQWSGNSAQKTETAILYKPNSQNGQVLTEGLLANFSYKIE